MGRAVERRLKFGLMAIALFGVWLWPQLDETAANEERAHAAVDIVHRARPVFAASSHRKWWAQWADGRARTVDTSVFGKPAGELGSVVCMTALPDRLVPQGGRRVSLTELAVRDLVEQPDMLVLTVPAAGQHADIGVPGWVAKYEPKLLVLRTAIDYGPATRIVGCTFAVPAALGDSVALIEVDDDDAYPANLVSGFVSYLSNYPAAAYSLSGFGAPGNLGEAGPPSLHAACPEPADAGHVKCTVEADILEGFMGIAVLRKYATAALERVGDKTETPLACFYGDDAFVSYSLAAAGAELRVVFDKNFNAFTFNRAQKSRPAADVPDKLYCLTSHVPGLSGNCPNMEAYALCKQWFDRQ
mmetsp:Transcript_20338/g.52749  ORF Transcript_20338/g.52749 Transcript_20338/m.52749 type:complete len:358 (+) Transcript_20338:313-1386(+)